MPALDTSNPQPGVYEDVDFPTYCLLPCVNKHQLDPLHERTPRHCQYKREVGEQDEERHLAVGRALHTLALRGAKAFSDEFAMATQCAGLTAKKDRCRNDGKVRQGGDWYCGTHAQPDISTDNITRLSAEEAAQVGAMYANLLHNTPCRKFLESVGQNELVLVWRDGPTGLLCKAMLDLYRPTWSAIADIKTTRNAHPDDFAKQIASYGYHRQAAFYLDGAKECGLEADVFGVLAVENEPPHVAATYEIDTLAVEIGRDQNRRLLETYARCVERGEWPGFESEFPRIGLPEWEIKKARREVGV